MLLQMALSGDAQMDDWAAGDDESRRMRSQSALNLLPVDPWQEPVDGGVLLDELRQRLRHFVVLPRWAAEILALWIVGLRA